jgi:hypothetical protein
LCWKVINLLISIPKLLKIFFIYIHILAILRKWQRWETSLHLDSWSENSYFIARKCAEVLSAYILICSLVSVNLYSKEFEWALCFFQALLYLNTRLSCFHIVSFVAHVVTCRRNIPASLKSSNLRNFVF